MNLVLLLIFAFTVKGDSDESKYVDLLPEEEKEEFIQKVARRIIENVETKEVSNKSSVEIPDDELKEHEALVKKILKEESSNIRRNRMEKEMLDAGDDVSVKSIENLKEMQRAGHIDLTMRSDRKKRRDGGDSSEITVEVVTDNVLVETKNFGSEVKTKTSDEKDNNNDNSESSKEDIQVRNIKGQVIEITSSNLKAENNNTTVVANETVQNIEVKYNDSSKEDANVKTIKRRAIENNTTHETIDDTDEIKANISNIHETNSTSASNDHNPTIMDDFDVETSAEESTENSTYTTVNNTRETTTTETTTTQEIAANLTTKGNESTENHQFTEAIYDSEIESDRDCSNETLNDEATALSNASVVEKMKSVKRFLRNNDYDIVTDAAEVNKTGNYTDTTEISIETVTGKNIGDKAQTSTNDERSPEKIIDNITITSSDSDENGNHSIGIIVPSVIIDDNNESDKDRVLFRTGDNNGDTVVLNNKNKATANVIVSDIVTVKNISHTSEEMTVPTNAVPSSNPVMKENVDSEASKTKKVVSRTRFAIVSDTNTDQATNVGTNKDGIQTINRNISIPTIIPGLATENNDLKYSILTTTESIIIPMATRKPARITSNGIKHQNKRENIYTANKKAAPKQIKFTTKTPMNIVHYEKQDQVADKAVNMLRDSLLLLEGNKKKERNIFEELQKEFYKQFLNSNKNKQYHVYEIPADKPPFIKDPVAFTEQPYYVPVYNYSPNKAYFNAKNRLGPNEDDRQNINLMETELGTDEEVVEDPKNVRIVYQYDSGTFKDSPDVGNDYSEEYNQRKKFGNRDAAKLGGKNIPRPNQGSTIVQKPANKDNNYIPDDYVDINYVNRADDDKVSYRSSKVFPDTDDESHPFNSIKERNLKDHIRAVRNLLYEAKLFSYPYNEPAKEEIETTTEPQVEEAVTDSKICRAGEKSSAISLDYYFGRMKPESEESTENSSEKKYYKKVGYFKKNNETRNLYMNQEFFNDKLIEYINLIKYKADTYGIDGDASTPHASLIKDIIPHLAHQSKFHEVPHKIKIISMVDEKDVFNTLERSEEFNETLEKPDDDINVYLKVLKDMVHLENNALKQYGWLETTVDLQSAMEKLMGLIEGVQSVDLIPHPSDLELLKYVVFIHKFSYQLVQSRLFADKLRNLLLHPKKKKKNHILKEKGLMNRVWLFRKRETGKQEDNNLENFNEFLIELQDAFYDLHEAIKNIAIITKYKKQNWFRNIKELYLTDDKSYLTLLLHLAATRLFGLIEDSARGKLEDNFRSYVKNNRKVTMKTVHEMLFVIRILDRIKMYE